MLDNQGSIITSYAYQQLTARAPTANCVRVTQRLNRSLIFRPDDANTSVYRLYLHLSRLLKLLDLSYLNIKENMSNNMPPAFAGSQRHVAFEEIEHTADRALRIYGSNLAELLLNAALGLNSLMVTKHIPCAEQQEKFVELEAMDTEGLLVDWLSELAYWAEIEMLVFHEFRLESVSPTHLRARIRGTQVTQLEKHIKAVTYHNLQIVQTEEGLTATVVFDV